MNEDTTPFPTQTPKGPFFLLKLWVSLSAGLSALFALLWLVNLEQALQIFWPNMTWLTDWMPRLLYRAGVFLSKDLSTISTLIPFLLFCYPMYQGLRILRHSHQPSEVFSSESLPYPPRFGFFLVMLGLTGTLYGLWIGLDSSGVAPLATALPGTVDIPQAIDRLLSGTATALLSSLLGLLGAFFEARPLAWIFRKAAGITEDEAEQDLEDTVQRLTLDLTALSRSARTMSESLNTEALDGLLQRLNRLEEMASQSVRTQERTNEKLELLSQALTNSVAGMAKMGNSLNGLSEDTQQLKQQLAQQNDTSLKAQQLLSNVCDTGSKQLQSTEHGFKTLAETLQATQQQSEHNRSALQRALAAYLK